ncbi:MAG: phosphoenolpyruvate--protein phosphotransferase [Kofleriaceae bacterium]|nr:phosphoenolpyruvate--protein phosphotransferase [Kofleriaceae bacterium]
MSEVARKEVEKVGIAACQGIAIGRAYIVDRRQLKVPKRKIDADEVEVESERFRRALDASERQLEKIKQKIEEREKDHYAIISAYQLILRDEHIVKNTLNSIRDELINAEWALRNSVEQIKAVFDGIEDDYFRERGSDVDFVGERILRNLMGRDGQVTPPPDAIVIAHDLSPADTAMLYRAAVAGIATDVGGKTSHTAIIARGYDTPAVVGTEDVSLHVGRDDLVIVDGTKGVVIINPTPETVAAYREQARREIVAGAAQLARSSEPAVTQDGTKVTLLANLDHLVEAEGAVTRGAEGVGLLRTEYYFMGAEGPPSEDEYFRYAVDAMKIMDGRPVTFRTLDLGSDKVPPEFVEQHDEPNPALGLRSIRLCLTKAMRPMFRSQLRGLLRASVEGNMKLMFPMISGMEELRSAKEVVEEVKQELRQDGIAFDEDLPLGIMIEMPSAAVIADHLAKETDFFSIGTNDLIQYTMAVDRMNEFVSYLYAPLHPALLRLISTVIQSADKEEIPVSICGEMAGDPMVALVLVGLGLRSLSMHSVAMCAVKEAICSSEIGELETLAKEVLEMSDASAIRIHVEAFANRNIEAK